MYKQLLYVTIIALGVNDANGIYESGFKHVFQGLCSLLRKFMNQGSSGAGEGFEVTKFGHGRVALIGFPRSVTFMIYIFVNLF